MRRTVKSLLLAVCIGFGAIGPAYAEELEFIGNSRIEMSDWLKKQWDKYQNAFNKGTLLIKFDEGKVWISHWACHSGHTSSDCLSENRSQMMYRVRMKSKKWQIFAEEGKIVWKGPVCYQGQNLSKFGDCQPSNISSYDRDNPSPSDEISKMPDTAVCRNATTADGNWEEIINYKKYVNEAKGRSLTLERCLELTGRPNPNITAPQSNSSTFSLKTSSLNTTDSKTTICRNALSEDGMNWETGKIFSEYVYEAKRRGYTTEDCAKINSNKATPTAPPNTSKKELIDNIEVRLKKLKKLEDAGLITSEEAAEKRKEILRDM